jgi:serine/threonine-protein kinase
MKSERGYQLGNKLGEGAYGKVYRGRHLDLNIEVCIKEIDINERDHFDSKKEPAILQSLNHPHIVTYIDDYQIDQKFYIVMELIEGGNLSTFIEKNQESDENIPEKTIQKIFSQFVSVLKFCRDHNIIHKDIKANNILCSKSGIVKLADFGLAKIKPIEQEEIELFNSSKGSLHYVSSEKLG